MLKIKVSEVLKIRFSYKITWSLKTTILASLKIIYECLFGMAVKFLMQVPLQCPHSFWKLLLSVPKSIQVKPLIWGSINANHSVGTRAPGHAIGMFPWDFLRIQERHWEYWRVIPLYDPFTDPVSTIKTFFTTYLGPSPFFFKIPLQFLIRSTAGQTYGRTLHNLLVPWTYSDK